MEVIPLFAINTFKFRLNTSYFARLIDGLYKLKQNDKEGREVSNQGGWQSNDITNSELFNSLLPFLNKKISKFFKEEYKVEEVWANISPKYSYNSIHTHSFIGMGNFPYNQLSGVMYLQCTKDSGDLNLYNPHFVGSVFNYSPKVGDVIWFPCTLPHSVGRNSTDVYRMSIAFNSNRIE